MKHIHTPLYRQKREPNKKLCLHNEMKIKFLHVTSMLVTNIREKKTHINSLMRTV